MVSFAEPVNFALTLGVSATISGLNFGCVDETPTAQLGSVVCATTAWTSGTAVRCDPVGGTIDPNDPVIVVVDDQSGTLTNGFTFDGVQ